MEEKVRRTPAKLSDLVDAFGLEILLKGTDFDTRKISILDVNRPALQLVGFYDYFEPQRLQILGRAEMTYLEAMTVEKRRAIFEDFFWNCWRSRRSTGAPCCARRGPRWRSPAASSTI